MEMMFYHGNQFKMQFSKRVPFQSDKGPYTKEAFQVCFAVTGAILLTSHDLTRLRRELYWTFYSEMTSH